jgi:hypothetical protein
MRSIVLLALACGCAASYGRFERGVPAPPKDSVAIAVLGGAGARGPAERDTAKAVGDALAASRTGDRDGVVLLVGDYAPHRYARGRGRRAKGLGASPVVTSALAASPRVGTRFAVRGVAERHHAAGTIESTAHAVVRIGTSGRGDVLSRCEGTRCTVSAPEDAGLVDLVVLDLEPWRVPAKGDDAALARIESLLDAVATMPGDTPRILVLSRPLEGAHETGLGGQSGGQSGTAATYHLLPPSLQRHVQAGTFVGVVAGGERSLHLSRDLTHAIQRSDRVWLHAPMWQVVSGNASNPWPGRLTRRTIWRGGIANRPDVTTFAPGFAIVHVDGSASVTIDLVARRRGRWATARTTLPLRPTPHPSETAVGPLNPCPLCTDQQAGERP